MAKINNLAFQGVVRNPCPPSGSAHAVVSTSNTYKTLQYFIVHVMRQLFNNITLHKLKAYFNQIFYNNSSILNGYLNSLKFRKASSDSPLRLELYLQKFHQQRKNKDFYDFDLNNFSERMSNVLHAAGSSANRSLYYSDICDLVCDEEYGERQHALHSIQHVIAIL